MEDDRPVDGGAEQDALNGAAQLDEARAADEQLNQEILPVPISQADKVDKAAFSRAKVVTITDVQMFLDNFLAASKARGSFVHPDVQQVHDYCTTFAPRRTEASEKIVRQRAATAIQHPYYWGLVMNLSPETPDELIHLVPELDPRQSPSSPFEDEDDIKALVTDMEAHRTGDI